tara:strand:- start:16 stop:330 length:315 start_codon:yes stop_codon:yes gene_type:complete
MKEKILITIIVGLLIGLVASLKKETTIVDEIKVTYEEPKKKEIPVSVTLTKYQLEKMLHMIDEDFGYGGNAAPQDSIKFTSIAKRNGSDVYNISSTHLARRPTE